MGNLGSLQTSRLGALCAAGRGHSDSGCDLQRRGGYENVYMHVSKC